MSGKSGNAPEKRSVIEKKINLEVSKDRNFLKKLKENPHQALREQLGVEIPAHIKISFTIEEQNAWHFVIRASAVSGQLTESDLEGVAGGDCYI